ncbi:MAG: hypothetical protein RH949_13320 [Coleofasciculus sp. A1-SPW-01]|uniref:hypothetical protein n=1 Tax=Coleofasciculus sp. A1-SPW-01 TaxID=3070819 RepID=UPI0032F226A0
MNTIVLVIYNKSNPAIASQVCDRLLLAPSERSLGVAPFHSRHQPPRRFGISSQ